MKKVDVFLENIGLKKVGQMDKSNISKIILGVMIVALMSLALFFGNKLLKNNKTKQEIEFKLNGPSTMVVYLNQEYKEPGYEAKNEYGKDINSKVEVIGNVDTKTTGIYDIIYRLKINNMIYTKTRTVTVVDTTKEIFMLLGQNEINIKKGEKYIEEGYFLILPGQTEPSKYVTVSGEVDENTPGIYIITYKLDYPTFKHELQRTINVIGESSLVPTITLNGNHSITLKLNEKYEEKGYTAHDTIDGDITQKVVIENNVKSQPGLYEIKYTVKNSRGFETSISRIVKVLSKEETENELTTYGGIGEYIKVIPSTKAITKDNITLEIQVISDELKSIILPDNTLTSSKNFKYSIKENGMYIIIVELKDGTKINGSILIDYIDKEPPSGTCQAVYKNGKVSFVVNANDASSSVEVNYDSQVDYSKCNANIVPSYCSGINTPISSKENATSGIGGYSYYNGEKYSNFLEQNTYEIETSKLSGYKVIIKDKIGNSTQIDCSSKVLSTVTGLKIIGETKAKLGDKVNLQVVFTPEETKDTRIKWEIIEGSNFGTINDFGEVTITDDGRYLLETDNYIMVKATSEESGVSATHKISVYLDEKRLNESGASVSGSGSAWTGGTQAGLANPNGIALVIGQVVELDISEYEVKYSNIKVVSLNETIVSVSGKKIKGEAKGNTEVQLVADGKVIKTYKVGVVDPKCGKEAQIMTQTYQLGEKDKNGNVIYGEVRSVADRGTIIMGVNQYLKVTIRLTQQCGKTEYLTRTSADGEDGWSTYFTGYSKPFVNRYDKATFLRRTTYDWMIIPKKTTGNRYIQLSQTSFQATEVYSEIKSFARVNVKVQEENVDIGKRTTISFLPGSKNFTQITLK